MVRIRKTPRRVSNDHLPSITCTHQLINGPAPDNDKSDQQAAAGVGFGGSNMCSEGGGRDEGGRVMPSEGAHGNTVVQEQRRNDVGDSGSKRKLEPIQEELGGDGARRRVERSEAVQQDDVQQELALKNQEDLEMVLNVHMNDVNPVPHAEEENLEDLASTASS